MKKEVLMIVVLMFLVGAVSAKTLIAGKIYKRDSSKTVFNASVFVNCNGHIQHTMSLQDGSYAVVYSETGPESCKAGDDLVVNATHPAEGDGQVSGVINPNVVGTWDLAIANVPLVPEFGLVAGGLTVLGALVIFFLVRRE